MKNCHEELHLQLPEAQNKPVFNFGGAGSVVTFPLLSSSTNAEDLPAELLVLNALKGITVWFKCGQKLTGF